MKHHNTFVHFIGMSNFSATAIALVFAGIAIYYRHELNFAQQYAFISTGIITAFIASINGFGFLNRRRGEVMFVSSIGLFFAVIGIGGSALFSGELFSGNLIATSIALLAGAAFAGLNSMNLYTVYRSRKAFNQF
jgi:hypothetical protein